MSATPMQTHPWEPWDLLSALGEGGAWLADFRNVRALYDSDRDALLAALVILRPG